MIRPPPRPTLFPYTTLFRSANPPGRDQLEKDACSQDIHVKMRAESYLKLLKDGQPLSTAVKLPVAVLRLGDDLTFVLMGGDRKSTRLNSSHMSISYAVFCLK